MLDNLRGASGTVGTITLGDRSYRITEDPYVQITEDDGSAANNAGGADASRGELIDQCKYSYCQTCIKRPPLGKAKRWYLKTGAYLREESTPASKLLIHANQ